MSINEAAQYKAAGFKTMICVDAPEVPSQATATAFFNHLVGMSGALTAVDLWEIGNEPDRPPFWHGTASQYVNIILKTAYNIMHPLGAKIVGAAPSWDPNYGQQMVNASAISIMWITRTFMHMGIAPRTSSAGRRNTRRSMRASRF